MPNIVVMIDPAEQEALRSGGVIPSGMFRSFDELPDSSNVGSGSDHSVYLWPYRVDYSPAIDEDAPESLPSLLGLPEAGEEELASERYAARLFGAEVFHVVFLDTKKPDKKGDVGFSGRKTTFGSLTDVVKWGERLKRAVAGRLHEEQASLVRHYMILIARGGQVVTTQEEAEKLQKTFEDKDSCLVSCFFLDFNTEVERGNILIHAKYIWPVLVGQLLLRFILDNTRLNDDDGLAGSPGPNSEVAVLRAEPLRAPGIHLWRAKEFQFEYPKDRLLSQWRKFTKSAFRAIGDSEGIDVAQGAGGQVDRASESVLEKISEPPEGIHQVLPRRPEDHEESRDSWDDASVDSWVSWAIDDERWSVPTKEAAKEFLKELLQASHRSLGLSGGKDTWYSPQDTMTRSVFTSVDKSPSEVFRMSNGIEKSLPNLHVEDDPFEKWKIALGKEQERENAKREVEWAGQEMKSAQGHFVPIDIGLFSAGAISLLCGFAIHAVVRTLGGSIALSLLLSSFAFAGAVLAVIAVHFFHKRAGRRGLKAFFSMCRGVDDRMEDRNEALFNTINVAAKCRDVAERRSSMMANLNLLKRVRRILGREIESPAVGVFFDEAENSQKKQIPDEGQRQREILIERTRFMEDLSDIPFGEGDAKKALEVVETYFPDPFKSKAGATGSDVKREEGRFREQWREWCNEMDKSRWGNYPAEFFIPRLRDFMQRFCDEVADALKDDVLERRNISASHARDEGLSIPPEKLGEELSVAQLSGFALASAHVDAEQVVNGEANGVLYVSKRFLESAKKEFEGRQDIVVYSSSAFSALQHYAFYFQDIHVRLGCSDAGGKNRSGRLMFACLNTRRG